MIKDRELPPGWRMSESYSESKQADYVKQVTKEFREKPRPIREVPTHFNGKPIKELSGDERNEFYISMQAPSTQAILRRDPKDDAAAWDRPINDGWKAVPDADMDTEEGRNKAVAKRAVDPSEAAIIEDTRRKSKNTIGDSELSSVTPENRVKGIEAFTYSKPADLSPAEIKKVTKLEPMVSTPLEAEKPKKPGFFTGFWSRFSGEKREPADNIRTKVAFKGNTIQIQTFKEDDED